MNIQFSGQPSPVKSNASTPVKGAGNRDNSMVQEDIIKFYKDSGLESFAREVGSVRNDVPRPSAWLVDLIHKLYNVHSHQSFYRCDL